jgi:hypothetical protein
MWATFLIFKKQLEVNIHSLGDFAQSGHTAIDPGFRLVSGKRISAANEGSALERLFCFFPQNCFKGRTVYSVEKAQNFLNLPIDILQIE